MKEDAIQTAVESVPKVINFLILKHIQIINYELILNIVSLAAALGSNNWLASVVYLIICCYNIYTQLRKQKLICMITECHKDNKAAGNRIGLIFKIKCFVYSLISMYALSFTVINFIEDTEEIKEMFSIFSRYYE